MSTSTSRYRALFENFADPILIIENDAFVECNQAAVDMLGYPNKGALLQCHPSEISPKYQADGRCSFEKANEILARASDHPYQSFEWDHVKADGTIFPVEVSLTAIPKKGGFTLHTTWRDISERKRLEKELRHSQKMEAIGKLASGIAHDFNNQLVPILGYSELLADALQDKPELREWALEIHRATSVASILVKKLLAFSRKGDDQPVILNLDDAVNDLLGILDKLIGDDIAVDFEPAGIPLRIKVGAGDIEQIVLNLASNSRDALPGGGELKIKLSSVMRVDKEFACLEVADDGVGMDKETLAQIFEPFFTTKTLGNGTGLGMSTVYGLMTNAGGHIYVKSSPDEGTLIELLFPIVDHEEIAATSTTPQEDDHQEEIDIAVKSHILVVEDEPQIGRLIDQVLRNHGFAVSHASNGRQALEMLESETPDLILTDVDMQVMSGPELLRQLNEENVTIPVVFMSAHSNDRLATFGIDVAITTVVRKPFSPTSLVKLLKNTLRSSLPTKPPHNGKS